MKSTKKSTQTMKPWTFAIALACATLGLPLPSLAAAPPAAHTPPAGPARTPPEWVRTSNRLARPLLDAQFAFQPEQASFFGVPGYDARVADLGPENGARFRAEMGAARDLLMDALYRERDPDVRLDLEIMIASAGQAIEGSALAEELQRQWVDAPRLMFFGLSSLLSEQTPPARRALALRRLQTYVGLRRGTESVLTQARARYEDGRARPELLRPTRLEVERMLADIPTYAAGIRGLFAQYGVRGTGPALEAMDAQLAAYADWVREEVLPEAREDALPPPALYAQQLRQVGVEISPEQLIQRARFAFMETRAAMQRMAPLVAREKGIQATDYRDVLRAMKRETIPDDALEAHFRQVIAAIDPVIRRERIVDVPQRPLVMRLGTAAESAAQSAPHFRPAPLVGNTGQKGEFVLPLGNTAQVGVKERFDDFNYPAVAWALSAHEGRPGHELQFTAMVERGISLARVLFAFNSVNVEGWALYAEAEMIPYMPLESQFVALQFRLMRAARAMLDPMLNLGMIDRARAGEILMHDVGISPAMTRQELDRYTFDAPGQATSYFHGYFRILELRAETELALGQAFDRQAFNNFLLDQALLPPDLLGDAVRERFVPKMLANAGHEQAPVPQPPAAEPAGSARP